MSYTHSFYLVFFCFCMIYFRGVGMFVGLFFKLIVLRNGFVYPCWKNFYFVYILCHDKIYKPKENDNMIFSG